MAKEISRQMRFIEQFEDSEPDVSHRVSFRFCRDLFKKERCLDLGCWTGRFIRQLEGRIIGADINHSALVAAKRANPNASFVQTTVQHLSFKNETFGIITMFAVIEHLPRGHEGIALLEVCRVLKKGGYLVLSTPNRHWMLDIFDIAHWMVGHRHYSLNRLEAMLNDNGFTLRRSDIIGGLLSVVFIPISYFLKYIIRLDDVRYRKISGFFDRHYDRPGFYDIYLIAQKV